MEKCSDGQRIKDVFRNLLNDFTSKERKLQLSELRYRRLFETAQDGILIIDADSGKIIDANPFLMNLVKYTRSELLGKRLWDIGAFKDVVSSKASFLKLQIEGYIRYENLPLQTKEGHSINVEFISNAYLVGRQKIIQCNIRDIAERKRVETELELRTEKLEQVNKTQEETRKSMLNVMEDLDAARATIELEKAKDDAIISSITDAVIACDQNGIILLINEMAEKLTGFSAEEAIGHHYHQVVTIVKENDGKPGNDFIAEATRNKKVTKMANHALLIGKNGAKVPISESAAPIVMENGTPLGCVVVLRDVTQERQIDRVKTEFVSLASHQLRTPLTIINWSSEILLTSGKLVQAQLQEVNSIHEACKRMVGLVDALLNVSRLEMGTLSVEPEQVNIANATKICIEELMPQIKKKKLTFMEKYDSNLTHLLTDPKLLNIILLNLLSNAVKYTPEGGKINLTVDKKINDVHIAVVDTGIGIPQKQQDKVFTKLFRVDNAHVIDSNGTGLGLYIVKAVTVSLGGSISFTSSEGNGSVFEVTLPLNGPVKKEGTKHLLSSYH